MRVYFIILVLALAACSPEVEKKRPKEVLSQVAMTDLLYDMQLVEARHQRRLTFEGQTLNESTLNLYKATLDKHGVSESQFVASHQYYEKHPEVMAEMYTEVLERLQAAQGELSKEVQGEESNKDD